MAKLLDLAKIEGIFGVVSVYWAGLILEEMGQLSRGAQMRGQVFVFLPCSQTATAAPFWRVTREAPYLNILRRCVT